MPSSTSPPLTNTRSACSSSGAGLGRVGAPRGQGGQAHGAGARFFQQRGDPQEKNAVVAAGGADIGHAGARQAEARRGSRPAGGPCRAPRLAGVAGDEEDVAGGAFIACSATAAAWSTGYAGAREADLARGFMLQGFLGRRLDLRPLAVDLLAAARGLRGRPRAPSRARPGSRRRICAGPGRSSCQPATPGHLRPGRRPGRRRSRRCLRGRRSRRPPGPRWRARTIPSLRPQGQGPRSSRRATSPMSKRRTHEPGVVEDADQHAPAPRGRRGGTARAGNRRGSARCSGAGARLRTP